MKEESRFCGIFFCFIVLQYIFEIARSTAEKEETMKPLFSLPLFLSISLQISAQCHPQPAVSGPAPDPCAGIRFHRAIPIPQPFLREADVMWSERIWRTIDLREKMNLALYYPQEPSVCLMNLFDVLKCAILNNGLTAFANPLFDDEFTSPMSSREVADMLIHWDSTHMSEDVNNPGNFIPTPLKVEISGANIRQYWIKEDWFFDRQRSVMEVRIIGICPLAEKTNEAGEVVGVRPLFWIYFPDARPFLATAPVYNFHNDSEYMSYDELFVKRRFASYIYKESNVYNRSIAEYRMGLDALLESESIKEDIFKFEDNMWHR